MLVVPAALGMALTSVARPGAGPHKPSRVALVHPRKRGENPLHLQGLTLIDQALERVHRAGYGDGRILQAASNRKIIRITGCVCAVEGHTCSESRAALERTFQDALRRRPVVTEVACATGRCDFVVAY